MNPYYIIVGQTVDFELTFWQEDVGWTASEEHATHYTADVLTRSLPSLPEGMTSIVLVDKSCKLLSPMGERVYQEVR